jgi:hypothetical protein
MKRSNLLLIAFAMVALLLSAACSPHRQLGFQAMLTDSLGMPVPDGDYVVIVRFWNHATSSSAFDGALKVYEDTQTVTVTDGFLNMSIPALVADAHELNPAQFAGPLWAEFEIEGEILTPRQKLLATPLAFSLVGGAAVAINETTAPPLIDQWPQQGALNVMNAYGGSGLELKGSTGLVVSILSDSEIAQVIRACAGDATGGAGCADEDLVFTLFGDGDVTAKGTFTGGGSGYAELIQLVDSAEPGDVLVVSSGILDRTVTRCWAENDTKVAGVYVADPGFIAGGALQDQPDMIPVAFSGVVPVKVTAVNGPIRRGDLLTTSRERGYAMLATDPQIGSILGKAMEKLTTGTGVIDVLLTLH